jgi:hypothetical protein
MCATSAHEACPYLGQRDDADTHLPYPDPSNHCHATNSPFSLDPTFQGTTCLSGDWDNCMWFREARGLKGASRSARAVGRPKRTILGYTLMELVPRVLVAIVLAAALYFFVSSVILNPNSAVRTAAVALFASTETPPPSLTPTPTFTYTPPPTTTNTPTWTPEPTSTSTPTPTPTPTPTNTPVPTSTPVPTATSTPTPTPTRRRVVVPTTRPSPTPTLFPAPRLISPQSGQIFSAGEEIVLRWESVGPLANNAYYRIQVAYLHFGETWYDDTPWTKSTSWALSDHAYLVEDTSLSDDDRFHWAVQVMRKTGNDADGKPTGVPASPLSEARNLTWRKSTGGGGGGGAPPPPPP